MKEFMGSDFMLDTECARTLYEHYADMTKIPVLDYHCHIDPKEICEDRRYDNITQLWLAADHYKWRQMRIDGVSEELITGNAPDKEKFRAWARTLPKLIGNPLYHWSHMELRYYFGYEGILNEDTADCVWDLCKERLTAGDMGVRGLIKRSNARLICTTDDPADDLKWHELIKEDPSLDVLVFPAFRPDRINGIEKSGFCDYMDRLSGAAGIQIKDLATLKDAVIKRLDHFADHGCRLSDHSMDYVCFVPAKESEVGSILLKALAKDSLNEGEILKYRTHMMTFLAGEYHRRGWVMQLHYGVHRNANSAMFDMIGPDTGFDCIRSGAPSAQLVEFLDGICAARCLPKTVIYSLDANDDRLIDSVAGCFQEDGVRAKIQHGSAWWFNDNLTGMKDHLRSVASQSVLGDFIGMLTDSRSFLSYVRHDYFRRILCRMMGRWVEDGWYPYDEERLGKMIKGIAYNNAVDYFGFDLEKI